MDNPSFAFTVLLTRDEYIAFRVGQKKQDRKGHAPLLTGAGAVGFLAGVGGSLFRGTHPNDGGGVPMPDSAGALLLWL